MMDDNSALTDEAQASIKASGGTIHGRSDECWLRPFYDDSARVVVMPDGTTHRRYTLIWPSA